MIRVNTTLPCLDWEFLKESNKIVPFRRGGLSHLFNILLTNQIKVAERSRSYLPEC